MEIAVKGDGYGPIGLCDARARLVGLDHAHGRSAPGCRYRESDIDPPEIVGLLAGFGTTFAAFPDLLAILKRRSSEGINPRMGTIMGAFQVRAYYGRLITSGAVIIWNVIASGINFLTVPAYAHFVLTEKNRSLNTGAGWQSNL